MTKGVLNEELRFFMYAAKVHWSLLTAHS